MKIDLHLSVARRKRKLSRLSVGGGSPMPPSALRRCRRGGSFAHPVDKALPGPGQAGRGVAPLDDSALEESLSGDGRPLPRMEPISYEPQARSPLGTISNSQRGAQRA